MSVSKGNRGGGRRLPPPSRGGGGRVGVGRVAAGVDGAGFALTPGETGAGVASPAAGPAAGACAKAGVGCAARNAKNRPKARSTPNERLMLPILMYRSKLWFAPTGSILDRPAREATPILA